jgi:hypothetical protein
LSHFEQSVFHDEALLHQESLHVRLLIVSLVCNVEVEPAKSGAIGLLREVSLDDLLKLVEPGLLQVIAGLGDARGLNLLELVNLHCLGDVGVVDIFGGNIIALLSDLLLSADNLIVAGKRVETEGGEYFVEVVLWNPDHAEVGGGLLLWGWGKVKLTGDEVVLLVGAVLVEDDLVHGLGKVDRNLVEKCCCVSGGLAAECLGVLSHQENAVGLVGVNFGDLVLGHVVDVVVVLDQGISISALLVSSGEPS